MSSDRIERRGFLRTTAGAVAACSLGGTQAFAAREIPRRPNVVLVIADQLRRDVVGYNGDPLARTPNIDRLAAESVSFTQTVANTPVCAAFRASLQTGKYATSTGMVINELRMNPDHRCLGHVVTDAGYETSHIGKWHMWGKKLKGADRHFIPRGPYRLGWDGYWAAYDFAHQYYKAVYCTEEPVLLKAPGYEPDFQTDLAIERIDAHLKSDAPFFLTLAVGTPHDPWRKDNVPQKNYEQLANVTFPLPGNFSDVADPYMDRLHDRVPEYRDHYQEALRCYYAMIANLDENVGRLVDALKKRGVYDDTVFIFTSDHGEMFGSHGRVQKLTFYEEAARIPFLVKLPNSTRAGKTSGAMLSTVDMAPTVLGLLGLPIPDEMEGDDLSGVVLGESGASEPEFVYLQGPGHTHLWEDGAEWRAIRDKRHTYAVYRRDGSELLFDNVADPLQQSNLIDDPKQRDVVETMRARLKAKREELSDPFETCTWHKGHWVDDDRNIIAAAKGPFKPAPESAN